MINSDVPQESGGFTLHLSSSNRTGFIHVYAKEHAANSSLPYTVEDDDGYQLGRCASAVEAAEIYARWKAGAGDLRICDDLQILDSNDKLGIDLRYLVERSAGSHSAPMWVTVRNLPERLVEDWEAAQRERRNRKVEPALGGGSGAGASGGAASSGSSGSLAESGVETCCVAPEDADECARFLHASWTDGSVVLPNRKRVLGYASYGKTLAAHDGEQQRTHTLLFTHAQLPLCRAHIPGFAAMEQSLARWLHERYGTVVDLYFAHGLRQGPETLASTGFDVHQVSARRLLASSSRIAH